MTRLHAVFTGQVHKRALPFSLRPRHHWTCHFLPNCARLLSTNACLAPCLLSSLLRCRPFAADGLQATADVLTSTIYKPLFLIIQHKWHSRVNDRTSFHFFISGIDLVRRGHYNKGSERSLFACVMKGDAWAPITFQVTTRCDQYEKQRKRAALHISFCEKK